MFSFASPSAPRAQPRAPTKPGRESFAGLASSSQYSGKKGALARSRGGLDVSSSTRFGESGHSRASSSSTGTVAAATPHGKGSNISVFGASPPPISVAVSEGTPVGAGLRADDLAHTPPSRDDVAEHGPGAEDSVNVTRMSNRPLPDQSAFDGSFARNSHVRPQEKAACPPTPVRAPPRQAPGGLQLRRFDSLQETKTLLEPGDDGMLLSPEPLAQDTSGAASAAAGGGRPTPGHPSASVQHHQRSDLGASRDSSNSLDDCDVIGLVDGSTDAPGHAGSRDSWLQVGSPHHPDGAACSAAVRCSSRGGGGASSPSAPHGGGGAAEGARRSCPESRSRRRWPPP